MPAEIEACAAAVAAHVGKGGRGGGGELERGDAAGIGE